MHFYITAKVIHNVLILGDGQIVHVYPDFAGFLAQISPLPKGATSGGLVVVRKEHFWDTVKLDHARILNLLDSQIQ